MMVITNKLKILIIFILLCIDNFAQKPLSTFSSLSFNATYIGDVVNNFSGGIKKGTTYLGLVNAKLDFNTEKARWWKGGELFVNLANSSLMGLRKQ